MSVLGKMPQGRRGRLPSRWSPGVSGGSGHFRVTLPSHTGTPGWAVPEEPARALPPSSDPQDAGDPHTRIKGAACQLPHLTGAQTWVGVGPEGLQLLQLLSLEWDAPATLMAGGRQVARAPPALELQGRGGQVPWGQRMGRSPGGRGAGGTPSLRFTEAASSSWGPGAAAVPQARGQRGSSLQAERSHQGGVRRTSRGGF